jgi:CelD/BcsL family acetyltransferase involved in cellulose biosynthesis
MTAAIDNPRAEILPSTLVVRSQRGGIEIVDRLADEWRELCDSAANDQPFYRPEWIRAYLRAYVPDAKVLIITAALNGRLSLVLSLVEEWSPFSKVPLRKLRSPVNFWAGRFYAIRRLGPEGDAAMFATWEHLRKSAGWDLLQFRDAPEGGTMSLLAAAARADGFRVIQQNDKPSPYLPVPSDPELLKQMPLNSRLRRELRQVRRQLSEQGSFNFYHIDTADQDALERFYRLEASGWKGREGSAIVCNQKNREFFDEIVESAARFGYFSLYMLEFKGQLMAAHLGFTLQGCYYSAIVAYDEQFKQFSPGHLIISEIVRDCAARGLRGYDPTGQNQEWKMKWTNQVRPMSHYFIFRGILGNLAYEAESRVRPAVARLFSGKNNRMVSLG